MITGLLLVTEGQNVNPVIGQGMTIQGDVAGFTKWDEQLTKFGQVREGPAYIWCALENEELALDGLRRSPGCVRRFICQKAAAALQASNCALHHDYSWQSGAAFSSSVPQVFNQERASTAVRCRPVS